MTDSNRPGVVLYTDATPNGVKISMALEELGIPYKTEHLNISTNAQKEPWFLEINPNGRIPAITDTFSDGKKIRLFESGSIFQYLTEQYDKDYKISYPKGSREYYEMNNWLWFQNAGLGPMQGQANHFYRYAPEKIEYGIKRYINETRRLYGVVDKHLESSQSGYLVGDHISIADITTVGWVIWCNWAGVDIEEFPRLKKWRDLMESREGIKRGLSVPKDIEKIKARLNDPKSAEEYAKQAGQWIQQGMKEDAAKKT